MILGLGFILFAMSCCARFLKHLPDKLLPRRTHTSTTQSPRYPPADSFIVKCSFGCISCCDQFLMAKLLPRGTPVMVGQQTCGDSDFRFIGLVLRSCQLLECSLGTVSRKIVAVLLDFVQITPLPYRALE